MRRLGRKDKRGKDLCWQVWWGEEESMDEGGEWLQIDNNMILTDI